MNAPPPTFSPPAAALQQLAAGIGQVIERGPQVDAQRLQRVEVQVETLPPLEWLRAQNGWTQYYWADRAGEFAMAGIGEADVVSPQGNVDLRQVFALLRRRLSGRAPWLRYYGGLRFTQAADKQTRWRAFTAFRFVVPRFELLSTRHGLRFACNFLVPQDPETRQELLRHLLKGLERIAWVPAEPPAPIEVLQREDLPDRAGWTAAVNRALAAFAANRLEKVVLARETTFTARDTLDPVAVLQQLTQRSPHSFEFCFHPVEDRAFIGASPERLFRRHNVYLQSEALAGTRPRGATDEEDQRLGEELLCNEKELREHRFVLRTLREHFQRYCMHFQEEEGPTLLFLRHCQHLYTRIEGLLRDPHVDAALLSTLHPTPAVGGTPREEALEWIQREEPFDRGIYAAPVGWVGYDGCEFCVAIRSALIKDNTLSVYTGAGIVPGSLPDEEWAEIEVKMGAFMDILSPQVNAAALPVPSPPLRGRGLG